MLQIRFYMKRNIGMRWFCSEKHRDLSNDSSRNPSYTENEEHDYNWWNTQLSSFEDWNNKTDDKDKLHQPEFKMKQQ